MNLHDEEWEPAPTDPNLLRKVRAVSKSIVSTTDLANLRNTLKSEPFNSAIPHEVRGSVWLLLLKLRSEELLSEDSVLFAKEACAAVDDENSREQIEKDVDRTRPALARFKETAVRGALLRLLSLFCHRRNVSYIQGFNELMAPFVLLADTGGTPRLVYALFNEFVARFAPWMLETSESRVFDVLKRMFKYFGRLLLYHDPELYWLLERHMMTPDLYATSWFVTLFARNFTVESVLALWDLLLLEDNPLSTTFFGVALLVSHRDRLMSIDESCIPETLMNLTASSPEEVRRLWDVGQNMQSRHTPPSFRKLMVDRLLNQLDTPTRNTLSAARAMQASVCLQSTPDDLVAGDTQYFTWDCRTRDEYNAGHLAQAAHLKLDALRAANGKFTQAAGDEARAELQQAVDKCESIRGVSHICLIGSGLREEDNTDVNMLALYLTRIGIPYVSTLRGGFSGALQELRSEQALSSVELVEFDPSRYNAARRRRAAQAARIAASDSGVAARGRTSGSAEAANAAAATTTATGSSKPAESNGGISSFLEKTDAEVSRALSRALNGIGLKYSLSSVTNALSSENLAADANATAAAPASPTSVPVVNGVTPPDADGSGAQTDARRTSATISGSPRWGDVPARRSAGGPSPGTGDSANRASSSALSRRESRASRVFASGLFAQPRSPWGRDAKPGWLDGSTLEYPVSAMPAKGFTVNVMDDRVMAGLRLFPCKARADALGAATPLASPMPRQGGIFSSDTGAVNKVGETGGGVENGGGGATASTSASASSGASTTSAGGGGGDFRRRYVGVSEHYFLLLSPYANRRHLLEVRLFRHLRDISRITFKRSRPELVTFSMVAAGGMERVICLMPDGLKECVDLIKGFIAGADSADAAGAANAAGAGMATTSTATATATTTTTAAAAAAATLPMASVSSTGTGGGSSSSSGSGGGGGRGDGGGGNFRINKSLDINMRSVGTDGDANGAGANKQRDSSNRPNTGEAEDAGEDEFGELQSAPPPRLDVAAALGGRRRQ